MFQKIFFEREREREAPYNSVRCSVHQYSRAECNKFNFFLSFTKIKHITAALFQTNNMTSDILFQNSKAQNLEKYTREWGVFS